MKEVDVAVVGAGPAGLAAALACGEAGAKTLIIDQFSAPGGQLVKQTHKFFGSERQFAGTRGISIPEIFMKRISALPNVEAMWDATASGYYDSKILTVENGPNFVKIIPKRVIFATGAAEKAMAFENNDLPGVYGAGAVQTLMNVYGVMPGKRVLMVGSGNIGLIVSYQLLQAGVEVAAVVEAAPFIGGYLVHAAKLRRAGVPILTRESVVKAIGTDEVEGSVIARLDDDWTPIPGTFEEVQCDVICLAVGLTPLADLLWQSGCKMRYVPELGGNVPYRDDSMRSSVPEVYVAGDAGGVEEASSAMIQGEIAGIAAAKSLGFESANAEERVRELKSDLVAIRSGEAGQRIAKGIERVLVCEGGWQ